MKAVSNSRLPPVTAERDSGKSQQNSSLTYEVSMVEGYNKLRHILSDSFSEKYFELGSALGLDT